MDVVVCGGNLVTPAGVFKADVGIIGERIVEIGETLHGARELDAAGCYVLPGAVDPHVHLQMPAGEYVSSDDFASGTVAAALGGTTTVIDFVEPEPQEDLLDALEQRQDEADGRVAIDYGLHMTIPTWHAAHPDALDTLPAVKAAGVSSFKLYLAYQGLRLDDAQLYRALEAVAAVDGLPIVHCENGPICEQRRARAVARGDTAPLYHARTRPPRQEAEAVSHAIDVAALVGAPIYVVHVSCAAALSRIQAARARGDRVYAETCPQYLLLDETTLQRIDGACFICAPPLRTPADHKALWAGLTSGTVDVLATDHCPFTRDEKRGHTDFTTVPGGLPSLQARLSLAHHFGREHDMTLPRWVEVCCTQPARLFGLRHKGQLMPGLDADVVIFDPRRRVTLQAGQTLRERVDWSPYEGLQVQGWPRDVMSRGRVVVRDGAFVGAPGEGRFVARERG